MVDVGCAWLLLSSSRLCVDFFLLCPLLEPFAYRRPFRGPHPLFLSGHLVAWGGLGVLFNGFDFSMVLGRRYARRRFGQRSVRPVVGKASTVFFSFDARKDTQKKKEDAKAITKNATLGFNAGAEQRLKLVPSLSGKISGLFAVDFDSFRRRGGWEEYQERTKLKP